MARFKARLVAQRFLQVLGIDFCETFAPTIRRKLLRIYLALCLALNLVIHQVNIVGAYLESTLNDNKFPILMKLPPGVYKFRQIWKRLLCRLLRSLYDLKQSGRLWNQNVIAFYKSIGFRQLNRDPSILIRQTKDEISIVSVYVDDFLLVSNEMAILEALKKCNVMTCRSRIARDPVTPQPRLPRHRYELFFVPLQPHYINSILPLSQSINHLLFNSTLIILTS